MTLKDAAEGVRLICIVLIVLLMGALITAIPFIILGVGIGTIVGTAWLVVKGLLALVGLVL